MMFCKSLFYSDLEVNKKHQSIVRYAHFGHAKVLQGAWIGGQDAGILERLLELNCQWIAEIVAKAGGHGGADAADVVAGLTIAGDGDGGEGDEAVVVLGGGEDDDAEGIAEADALAEHVERGPAGEAGADAQAAGGAFDAGALEVGEVALVGRGSVDIFAPVLGEDGFRQHALESAELDGHLHGAGGGNEGSGQQGEAGESGERQASIIKRAGIGWPGSGAGFEAGFGAG